VQNGDSVTTLTFIRLPWAAGMDAARGRMPGSYRYVCWNRQVMACVGSCIERCVKRIGIARSTRFAE
jgi:hypothetical protein